MAAQIGSLYVDLTMNSGPFVAGMNSASQATSRGAAAINRSVGLSQKTINAFTSSTGNRSFRPYAIIAASRGYETAADRANLLRGSLLSLTAVAGGFAAALGTNLLSRYADTAINLSNSLKTVTTSSSNLVAVQDALQRVADSSRSSLQSTITLYARTARASEKLGLSQESLLRITETVQKAFSVGGATTEEAQGAAIQLSQAIASNRFSGDEFRSVAENAPVLLTAMAKSLGVTIGKLREMGQAGQLTAEIVTKAILKSSDSVDAAFAKTNTNIDRSITHVDNKLLEFIGNLDKGYGLVGLLAKGITAFGDNLEQIIPPLAQIAALVGAVFLAKNKGAIGGGLGALLGGGIGLGVGGIQGAVLGSAIGGFGGFAASKSGASFIGAIKVDAIAARAEVVRLWTAEATLQKQTLAAGRQFIAMRQQISTQGVSSFAPKSAQNDVARATLELQRLDAELAAGQQIAQQRALQAQVLATATANAQIKGGVAAKQALGEQGALYKNLKTELSSTSSQLGIATKASSAFSVGLRAVGRAGASLVGLFGGPWGIAITGAALIFANFAEDAQRRAQSIANAKGIIDEVLKENPAAAPTGNTAGSLLAAELDQVKSDITTTAKGANDAYHTLRNLLGLHWPSESPIEAMALGLTQVINLPIQGAIDKLQGLLNEYVSGSISATDFASQVEALKTSTNNSRFDDIANQVQGLTDTIVRAGPAVDALKQKIVDLQALANDPINVVVTASFAAIDAQPVNAPLQGAVNNFVGGKAFTDDLEKELDTLRLVGDARKKAEYTDQELKKAEAAKVVITDAVRARIAAFADEKVALENRDAAVKKAAKDDPYEKAITSLQQKTVSEQLDARALTQSTYAIEKAKSAQELLNAALEAKRKITPELIADIDAQSAAYARQATITQALTEDFNFYKDVFSSFFSDLKSSLMEGASIWESFAKAALNALDKIADRALSMAADGLFNIIFGALTGGATIAGGAAIPSGGFVPGITGPKLFAAGGYTGAGGKMKPAGIVHAGEYVMDAKTTSRLGVGFLNSLRGYSDGGYVTSPAATSSLMTAAANENATKGHGGESSKVEVHFHGVTDMPSFQKSRGQIATTVARAAGGARRVT